MGADGQARKVRKKASNSRRKKMGTECCSVPHFFRTRYCFLTGAGGGADAGLTGVVGAGRAPPPMAGFALEGSEGACLSYRSITSLVMSTVFDAYKHRRVLVAHVQDHRK